MGTLKYKGYTGSVEYSELDDCLFGKVQCMHKHCITYEGNSIAELKKDFEEAIDSYLNSCKERNVAPLKPYSGCLNIRISPEVHSRIADMAREQNTTINAVINNSLRSAVGL